LKKKLFLVFLFIFLINNNHFVYGQSPLKIFLSGYDFTKDKEIIAKYDLLHLLKESNNIEQRALTRKYKEIDGEKLYLDIYPPINKDKKNPVLVYFHYGYWKGMGRTGILNLSKPLLYYLNEQGFYVISVDGRQLPKGKFPNNVKDCKDAIRWIYKNSESYGFDTKNIGVLGASSGGHLALLTAFSDNNSYIGDNELASYPSKVNYAVVYGTPTYFSKESESNPYVKEYLGEYAKNRLNYIKASPIHYMNKKSIPILLIHGTKDTYVPFEHSQKILKKAKELGLDFEFIKIENGGHTVSEFLEKEISPSPVNIVHSILEYIEQKSNLSKDQ
jgi:acetyl esterase/lipase